MINRKTIDKSMDAMLEITQSFKDNTNLKDGLQKVDFEKPFAVVFKNGSIIYETFNPLENSVYLGDEKLKLDWEINPGDTDFSFALTQKFKNDDIKIIYSMDGNIIKAMESKPGDNNINAKLELKIKI